MPVFEFINGHHPLSRFYLFKELRIGEHIVNSIEMAYWHLMLKQHNNHYLDRKMRKSPTCLKRPPSIAFFLRENGFQMKPEWVFRAGDVYLDILLRLIKRDDNIFHYVFFEFFLTLDHPHLVEFINCQSKPEFVWSCGLRQQPASERDTFPGFNLYGEALTILLRMALSDNPKSRFGTTRLSRQVVPLPTAFRSTVLLLSDSLCGNVVTIDGGRVISRSGGQFKDLKQEVEWEKLRLSDYAIVIFNCGINDAQRRFQSWKRSWREFSPMLSRAVDISPSTKFLVSCSLPHPWVENAEEHSNWIQRRLAGTSVMCLNWFTLPNRPFGNGVAIDDRYYNEDSFHVNHAGFRKMWIEWANMIHELRYVNYTMSAERHTVKRDHLGNILR